MHPTAKAILAELEEKRELRRWPKQHFSDYISTYAFMAVYAFMAYAADMQRATGRLMFYFGVMAAVAIAIADSKKAVERRLDKLIDRLEKKGSI